MATLALSAVGTIIGGPIGGQIGALAGRAIDGAIFKPKGREGPRLEELAVTTSSYGQPIAQVHGTMRRAGSIIWATDLVETGTTEGGKGQPDTINYTYAASFAVALSSAPIARLGRVWADGTLLRGSAGDLKVGGTMRLHRGLPDQQADPLIAASEGADCPAFRGLAYVVFEDVQLADFGNRIPTLSFEVIGSENAPSVAAIADAHIGVTSDVVLSRLTGFALAGPPAESLQAIATFVPLECDSSIDGLVVFHSATAEPRALGEPSTATGDDRFGPTTGRAARRLGPDPEPPYALRYYDPARDYQPGQQRAPGGPPEGQPRVLELPAAITATDARALIESTARRHRADRTTIAWRDAALDDSLSVGAVVTVPGESGHWRIAAWEWRAEGVELELRRIAPGDPASAVADPGQIPLLPDLPIPGTELWAFELPFDGYGDASIRSVRAMASAPNAQWPGAALYAVEGDSSLREIAVGGRSRAITGAVASALPPSSPVLFDRQNAVDVQLLDASFALSSATPRALAFGANRAMIGAEMIQFAEATPLGDGLYRLVGLLRGRGGTEHRIASHSAAEVFALLDGRGVDLAEKDLLASDTLAAIGIADAEPATTAIVNPGIATRPLCPVHPDVSVDETGAATWCWTRRARGAWVWRDEVDVPLGEQAERYEVAFAEGAIALARWETPVPSLTLEAATLASLQTQNPSGAFSVRQHGDAGFSLPLALPSP